MPGIFGIISKYLKGNECTQLEVMKKIMLHEEYYTSSTYCNEKLGIFVGGISLQDSFSDCLPIYNEKKDLILFFSGECFFHKDLLENLKIKGHEFNQNNASSLIHLYEERGDKFFETLNGWFSGLLIDLRQSKVILFNDRFGIMRIYYHESNDAFYFSSEAKALLKILPILRNVEINSIAEYFIFETVLGNKTFFKKIYLLPPASFWIFRKNSLQKNYYFNPKSWEEQSILDASNFFEKFVETFKRVLPNYFRDSSLGMSLTGGLDTRMILSCFKSEPGQLPCYTFGGMYRDSFDVRIASKIAKIANQNHYVLRLGENFLRNFDNYAQKTVYITDGQADVNKSHGLYLNKMARKIAPVRMTGKFGSQVMRGVSLLRERSSMLKILDKNLEKKVEQAKNKFKQIKAAHKLTFILFQEIPWYWAGFTTLETSQISVRSPFLDNEIINLLYRAPKDFFSSSDLQLKTIAKCNHHMLTVRTNWGLGGHSYFPISKIIQLFYKFLNNSDKFYNWERMPNWAAKIDYFFAPLHFERLVLGYDQYTHYRKWFRDELSTYLKDILLNPRAMNRPYINGRILQKIIEDHTKGSGNYLNEITKVFTLELIFRNLIEEI